MPYSAAIGVTVFSSWRMARTTGRLKMAECRFCFGMIYPVSHGGLPRGPVFGDHYKIYTLSLLTPAYLKQRIAENHFQAAEDLQTALKAVLAETL